VTHRKFVCLFLFAISFHSSAEAGLMIFLDHAEWLSALSNPLVNVENFTGDATAFEANSSGNLLGSISVNLQGGNGDPGPTGLRGNGFFQGEVDSSGTDALSLLFSFDSTNGFALSGLQNDSISNPSTLALDEIGLSIGAEQFVLSDLAGTVTSDLPFLGFVSNEAINSFSLFHSAEIRSMTRTSEEFYLDSLLFAKAPAAVSEPPMLFILMTGLLGLGLARGARQERR